MHAILQNSTVHNLQVTENYDRSNVHHVNFTELSTLNDIPSARLAWCCLPIQSKSPTVHSGSMRSRRSWPYDRHEWTAHIVSSLLASFITHPANNALFRLSL